MLFGVQVLHALLCITATLRFGLAVQKRLEAQTLFEGLGRNPCAQFEHLGAKTAVGLDYHTDDDCMHNRSLSAFQFGTRLEESRPRSRDKEAESADLGQLKTLWAGAAQAVSLSQQHVWSVVLLTAVSVALIILIGVMILQDLFLRRRPLDLLAPLLPEFAKQHSDMLFTVSMEQLVLGVGSSTVFGSSGNPIMRASIQQTSEARAVKLSMLSAEGPLISSVALPVDAARAMWVIAGNGRPYGALMRSEGGSYTLVCKDNEVLTLCSDEDGTNQLLIYKTGNSEPVGMASRYRKRWNAIGKDGKRDLGGLAEELFIGAEHLQLFVKPGGDVPLILSCVLAIVVVQGTSVLGSLSDPEGDEVRQRQ